MATPNKRQKLRSPTLLTKSSGIKSIVWILPGKAYAEKFKTLLEEETGIQAIIKPVDSEDVVVSAEYPTEKGNSVIFVCWLLNEFYKKCQKLEKIFNLEISDGT
jgi:hypothetical protein